MDFLKTKLLLPSLLSLLVVSSCSDIRNSDLLQDMFQSRVVENPINSDKFQAKCELNVDDFSLIMEEDISSSIDCLGKNLNLFITAVESKKKGYLSRTALENYLKRNRKDIKPEVIRALKSVYDINFLVYGEDRNYISKNNVDALVKFAKIFNNIASQNFKKAFKDKSEISFDNYTEMRDLGIKPAARVVSAALTNIFKKDRKGQIHELDLIQLIDSFSTENNEEDMAKMKKLLFVKKVLLGGSPSTITHLELDKLIENFSSYVHLALDAVRYKKITLVQKSTVQLLNTDLELLNSLVFPAGTNRTSEELFTLKEAIDAAELFMDDSSLNLFDYYDLLKEAKLILMDGTPTVVTASDLRRLFSHGLNILKTGTLFHRFWTLESKVLERRPGKPLTMTFSELIKDNQAELPRVKDFIRIVKKYRFMRGENLSAYYTDEYMRNADAVFEIALYEYALKLVMKKFGCPNNTLGGKVVCDTLITPEHEHMRTHPEIPGNQDGYVYMKKDHVIDLIQKFRKVLIDEGMVLPGREEKTAETITLLGSLFQYQSDENKVFDVNEATEFVVSLFTATDISSDIMDDFYELESKGQCQFDKYDRVSPECFDKQFFKSVCRGYSSQFPKLFDSLGTPRDPVTNKLLCDQIPEAPLNSAYLDRAVVAARTCQTYPGTSEVIYYSKGDVMSVFLAMMHIETTILRWDVGNFGNPNNIMDPPEVMAAYNIYSPALDGFLETLPPTIRKLKKQIYQYLVKYEKVPSKDDFKSILKFGKFLATFNKNASANRKTIASILVTISEQGAVSNFDCCLLRDPNNLPSDYNPTSAPVSRVCAAEVPSKPTPVIFTQDDRELANEINKESDSWIRVFLRDTIPDFFGL